MPQDKVHYNEKGESRIDFIYTDFFLQVFIPRLMITTCPFDLLFFKLFCYPELSKPPLLRQARVLPMKKYAQLSSG